MKLKKILLLLAAILSVVSITKAQNKYIEKDGEASFFSSAPLEDIEAVNNQVQSVIDMGTKEVAIVIPIRQFKFDKSLMEEHFNENYLESEKYPKATFKGTYTSSQDIKATKDGTYPVDVNGNLTIHGVTHSLNTTGTIEVKGGVVSAKTKFDIRIADYKIKIPKMVFKNIAEVVEVKAHLTYDPFDN